MASSSDRRIDLALGAETRLPLTSAGSTGYEWRTTVNGDAVEVRIVSERLPAPIASGSFPLFLVIKAVHLGTGAIHLALVREALKPPRENMKITVTVHSA